MTLPSKYRSPRSRDFKQYYFYYILGGGIAIAICIGVLQFVEKYGSAFFVGWTIHNNILLVGYSAMFILTAFFSRRLFKKIIGRQRIWEMTIAEYLLFRFGWILLATVILTIGILFIRFLASQNLYTDP